MTTTENNTPQSDDNKFHIPFYEKHAFKFFIRAFDSSHEEDQHHDRYDNLSSNEIRKIGAVAKKTYLLAGAAGALGVSLLYIPQIFFPFMFLNYHIALPTVLGMSGIDIPIGFTIYGVVLALLEIYLLGLLNLRAAQQIALICGFPNQSDKHYEEHLYSLYQVGLEKTSKKLLEYNLDPWFGLSKFQIMIFQLFNKIKATLSNMVIKVILSRILARFTIRAYVDLIGIPIFAAWNIYSSNKVINEAKIRIMAPSVIKKLTKQIKKDLKKEAEFKTLLYDVLQYITIIKRDFHYNHYILAHRLINSFEVEVKPLQEISADQLTEKLQQADEETKNALAKVLAIGILIDGHLSLREKKTLAYIKDNLHVAFDLKAFARWERSFLEGNGLNELIEADFIP
ncbi:MAG: hypothetical protein EAZ55_10605 [Cytophagales bacterium]|nr:MAG: hypothetical protein EAZ55_10605 [Cytophagales bacterium]